MAMSKCSGLKQVWKKAEYSPEPLEAGESAGDIKMEKVTLSEECVDKESYLLKMEKL
jgi:hypothetical protein